MLTGHGTYVDDVVRPGMLHACFVRSPFARARIVSIDASAALELDGVHAVFTAADLNPGVHEAWFAIAGKDVPDSPRPAARRGRGALRRRPRRARRRRRSLHRRGRRRSRRRRVRPAHRGRRLRDRRDERRTRLRRLAGQPLRGDGRASRRDSWHRCSTRRRSSSRRRSTNRPTSRRRWRRAASSSSGRAPTRN